MPPSGSALTCTVRCLILTVLKQNNISQATWITPDAGGEIFTTKALDEIHKASAGIPRMINRVCEKALMYAFQNQKRLIDDYMIKFVVEHEMLGMVTS